MSFIEFALFYPPAAEDHIVELLLNEDPPLSGFTTWRAEDHGHDFGNASVQERVRGRAARGVLGLIPPRLTFSTEPILEQISQWAGSIICSGSHEPSSA